MTRRLGTCAAALLLVLPAGLGAQIAVRGEKIYTLAGEPLTDGLVLIRDGKIAEVGPAGSISIPEGFEVLKGKVVTPGLIDAHSVVGLSGYLNQEHDQDQLERSDPVQPELRAIDAYDPLERLVEWVRSFGVTTLHTGHGPGKLISGQTLIAKTRGKTVAEAVIVPAAMVAATLGDGARESRGSPGTRARMIAMLRTLLVEAREYRQKREGAEEGKEPSRDLRKEAMVGVLNREFPLLVTVNRSHDIMSALRLAAEFEIDIVLDGAAEVYLVLDEVKTAGFPVILHPTLQRAFGERENLSMETAARVKAAGIPLALQSGYESYVPKTRVVLFEAALAAAHGLSFEEALASITRDAARILGVGDRVGTLEAGKDGDLVLFNGDPFEYTTHVTHVIIEGEIVSQGDREWR